MGQKFKKMGIRASHTAEVVLDDVRLPGRLLLGGKERLDERLARARAGQTGQRGQAALSTFETTRPAVGAQAVGVARAAYEYALGYAKERKQFGRAIIENQAIAFKLAEMRMYTDAARLLVWNASWRGASGKGFDAARGLAVEAVRRRDRGPGHRRRHPDPGRRRLHPGPPGGALAPRRQDLHHLRGDQRDPAPGHRPGHLRAAHSVALTCYFVI